MKTQTHYTTSVQMVPWMRRNAAALAAVLALAAVVGLVFALGRFGQPSHSATRGTAAAPVRSLIAGPRLFRDEVLGADQANLAFLSINTVHRLPDMPRASAAHVVLQRLAGPRAFRDEVLGANQANLASLFVPGSTLDQRDVLRWAGPR